ncbi:MAG: UDP-N-acetylglucosamine 2-epimerase (non-hydrolyzing) [Thermoplasmata archaeon M11B2D]|nr:MAG: UDP-N-acetylglucosamine 2-epimerase (non-hydrolyzing) [Thermoplasmata archaeon M11B2D]
MKVMTILGTRPEIIRLSRIIPKLDKVCDHVLVHTGQNYDTTLNHIFFRDLSVRQPDVKIDSKSSTLGGQLAKIFEGVEQALLRHQPEKVLILGDTNTSLCAVLVERLGFPVYHMEAGNRCFDLKVPEEKNRRVIDCVSSFNLPYTPGSRENLLREGCDKQRIFETGNPIYEALNYYSPKIDNCNVPRDCPHVLVTAHRAENVDVPERLSNIIGALNYVAESYNVIFSCHPRTRSRLSEFGMEVGNVHVTEPLGFFEFAALEKTAQFVITDSGTVQEECCIFNVPTVTIRDSTERPETVECGSNIVSGLEFENIVKCVEIAKGLSRNWKYPAGYIEKGVSDRVVNFLLGNQL